jgi:hypothetical protein
MGTIEAPCLLLKAKYDLHKSTETESAVKRIRIRTGEKVSQSPLNRIQNYLNRFGEIINHNDPKVKTIKIKALKKTLYEKHIIKPNEVPESYFETQRRLARELGYVDPVIHPISRKEMIKTIIADQKSSLDTWINYLASNDSPYPISLKYFTLRSVLDMGDYDNERKIFTQRSKRTTRPFVELNHEALAHVLDALEKKYNGRKNDLSYLQAEDKMRFEKLLMNESFTKLYAFMFKKVTAFECKELLENTRGVWRKYDRYSDQTPLVKSLEGHGTHWCTAADSAAKMQLQGGDFYVYYSLDKHNQPTVPRVAIRMEDSEIKEVRGIKEGQNLDSYIGPVVEEKLKEFPDGDLYKKRVHDMKLLTEIEMKIKKRANLTKQDVVFLYEMGGKTIEGFGHGRDPRIDELLSKRNAEEDMLIFLDCSRNQIAYHASEINSNTKGYLGYLEAGIFDKFSKSLEENSYVKFPGEKIEIKRDTAIIGGRTSSEILDEMRKRKINTSSNADKLISNKKFNVSKDLKNINLIILKIGDFGLKNPTTLEIYSHAQTLGIKLCTLEIAAHYRISYANQPKGEHLFVAMAPVNDRLGTPSILQLGCNKDGIRLRGYPSSLSQKWRPETKFIFQY